MYKRQLQRLIRVISYCFRFIYNLRSNSPGSGHDLRLSREELNNTLNFFIRQSQLTYFHKEIIEIKNGNLSKSSKIISLDPFIDDSGLLRVGGRLQHSDLHYDTKHQIILHPKAHLTRLIIEAEHSRLLHAGVQLTHSSVRQRY